jgi:hypothetical protein
MYKNKFSNKKKIFKVKKVARRGRKIRVRYSYCPLLVKSDIYTVTASGYETQNLNLDIYNYLYNNTLFNNFRNLYQQYKLNWIRIAVTPIINQGTYPPVAYGLFLTSDSQSVQYSQIPTMPGSVKIRNTRPTSIFIKNNGRQNDFNYWNDTEGNVSQLSCSYRIRLSQSLAEIENNKVGYSIQIKYALVFRRLYPKEENRAVEDFETVGLSSKENELSVSSEVYVRSGAPSVSPDSPEIETKKLVKSFTLDGAPKETKSDLCKIYQKFKPIEVKNLPLDETVSEEKIYPDIEKIAGCKDYYDNIKKFGKETANIMLNSSKERLKNLYDDDEVYESDEEPLEIYKKNRRKLRHKPEPPIPQFRVNPIDLLAQGDKQLLKQIKKANYDKNDKNYVGTVNNNDNTGLGKKKKKKRK